MFRVSVNDASVDVLASVRRTGWRGITWWDWSLFCQETEMMWRFEFAGQLRGCYSPKLPPTAWTPGATTVATATAAAAATSSTSATATEAQLGNRHVPWVCSAVRRRQQRRGHRRRRWIRSQRAEKPTDRRRRFPVSPTRSTRPPQDRKRPHRPLRWRRRWRLQRLRRPHRPARSRRCAAWPKVAAPIKITATVSFLTAVKWVVVLNEDLWEQH